MSGKAVQWAIQEAMDVGLDPTARHVLIMLAHHANWRTGECRPSVPCLARETGWSPSTVTRALARITDTRIVTPERRPGKPRAWQGFPQGNDVDPPHSDGGLPTPRTVTVHPQQRSSLTPSREAREQGIRTSKEQAPTAFGEMLAGARLTLPPSRASTRERFLRSLPPVS